MWMKIKLITKTLNSYYYIYRIASRPRDGAWANFKVLFDTINNFYTKIYDIV